MRPGGPAGEVFLGRSEELAQLEAALREAEMGQGQLFFFFGEPGIGKTRLAEEFGRLAGQAGASVAWGRCWEGGGAPSYWPWIGVLRSLLASTPAQDTLSARHAAVVDLVAGAAAPGSLAGETDPDQARFMLFEAVSAFLRECAAPQPVVIVLDDLHAADESSLRLLQFTARDLRGARLVVLGTYRELEARRAPRLYALLGAAGREGRSFGLHHLSASEVADLVASRASHQPADSLVSAIYDATGGNPFFVNEVVTLLEQEGRLDRGWEAVGQLGIPEGVRQTLRQRMDALSPDAHVALSVASVVGTEFPADALVLPSGLSAKRLFEVLDEAVATGLARPTTTGRYAFSHALVRETVYDDLGAAARMALHRAVAEGLEALHGDAPDAYAAEIAHHYLAAAPAGGQSRAAAYAIRAGDVALLQLAYEESARYYRAALAAGVADDDRHGVLLSLATAELRAGRADAVMAIVDDLLSDTGRAVPPELAARGALLWVGAHALTGESPRERLATLERTLERLPEGNDAPRARVLAAIADQLMDVLRLGLQGGGEPRAYRRAEAALVEAASLVEASSDLALRAELLERTVQLLPEHSENRLALAEELLRVAGDLPDPIALSRAFTIRIAVALESGDTAVVDEVIGRGERLARRSPASVLVVHAGELRAMRALLAGDFAECERLGEEVVGRGGPRYRIRRLGQLFLVRWEQDRLAEVEPELREASRKRGQLIVRAFLAIAMAETGQRGEAHGLLADMLSDPFLTLHRERPHPWTATVAAVSEVAIGLADAPAARMLSALLAPFSGRIAAYGTLFCLAPVSYYLGRLAMVQGELDVAVEQLRAAAHTAATMGSEPWRIHSEATWAAALVERGRREDMARAGALREAARARAEVLGMSRLVRLVTGDSGGAGETAPPGKAVLAPEGDVWRASFQGHSFAVKDSAGLRHLARLLRAPGQEFHALDLVAGETGGGGVAVDATGPLLDPQAKAAYKRRLDDLRERVDDGERSGDSIGAARAQDEIDFLARELAAAVGLGGRDRSAQSASERARQAVTKSLRRAIERIAEQHPGLGEHLSATVRTGTYCSYSPDPRLAITWEM